MSLRPDSRGEVPPDTLRVAQAAFPKGNRLLRLRDELGRLYEDATFAALYPVRGQPAAAPWRLATVLVLQFLENLPDRDAAEAVRARIDWKYVLGLELTDPGFDASVLSEFRARLVTGGAEEQLLEVLLARLQDAGLLKPHGRQRTDSTHVLAAVRGLNRLELALETMRHALNAVAAVAPVWLRQWLPGDWLVRYGPRVDNYRLPSGAAARRVLAVQVGQDGYALLAATGEQPALAEVAALATLRRVWWQQFQQTAEATVHWRDPDDLPPASQALCSPHDPDARLGAKLHVTETCDAEAPHLLTHVATTPAPVPDTALTDPIEAHLVGRGRAPAEHAVDSGYVDAANLVASQARGIDLIGPPLADTSWQGRADQGFASGDFVLDWADRRATCPGGQRSAEWRETTSRHGTPVVAIRFARTDCQACPVRPACTQGMARTLTLRPQAEHEALQAARARLATGGIAAGVAARAGIEGTISQAVAVGGVRRARYRGLPKLHLAHLLTAVALNLLRLIAWWEERPLAAVHPPRFVRVATATAGT